MNIIPYNQGQVSLTEYPKHITHREYLILRESIHKEATKKFKIRDVLFIDLLWATGARVQDVCNLRYSDFNFDTNIVHIFARKVKKEVKVTLDNEILKDVANYCIYAEIKGKKRLFNFNRQTAWEKLKRYGKLANISELHPHMFRHGLAIYLMLQGVPSPVISARLGHSNVFITWQMYNKVTPEVQEQALKDIKWR